MNELQFYIDKIKKNEHFSFVRYGDGEWFTILGGKKGQIVKNETDYNHKAGIELKKTIDEPKDYYYGIQGYSLKRFKIQKRNWHDADVFHHASIAGKLFPLIKAMREKPVVFIGANYLRAIDKVIPYDHFIEIPDKNCYEEKDRILKEIRDYGKPAIYSFSASILSCILIYELDIKDSWLIDFGSLWDLFVKPTRGYQLKMSVQAYYKNLGL